jgi:hypothetical protein
MESEQKFNSISKFQHYTFRGKKGRRHDHFPMVFPFS